MIVEGYNVVNELIKNNYKIEKILIADNNEKLSVIKKFAEQKNILIEIVSKEQLNKITKSKNHQNIIAFVPSFKYCDVQTILDAAEKRQQHNFIIIIDGIQDPHNLGSIIRTAECAGADGIIIGKNRCCDVNETVFKTSAGAVASINIAQVVNINQTIDMLKNKNIWVYALEANSQSIYQQDFGGNIALVIGSEGNGVSHLTKKICDGIVSLPLLGKINSLNASNAAAVGIYEVVRQRGIYEK